MELVSHKQRRSSVVFTVKVYCFTSADFSSGVLNARGIFLMGGRGVHMMTVVVKFADYRRQDLLRYNNGAAWLPVTCEDDFMLIER